MKKVYLICTPIFIVFSLFPQTISEIKEDSQEGNNFQMTKTINYFLPGYNNFQKNEIGEGLFYSTSIPLFVAGAVIMNNYYWNYGNQLTEINGNTYSVSLDPGNISDDGKTYLNPLKITDAHIENEWMLYSGMIMSLYGALIYSYSQYDTFFDLYGEELIVPREQYSLPELMFASYQPENVFNSDVLPILPLLVLTQLQFDDYKAIGNYFQKDTIQTMGLELPPAAALGVFSGVTLLFVTANATWEEIFFRGMINDNKKISITPVLFGALHLTNMTGYNVSVEDTLIQTGFATLFGYYAELKVRENPNNFKRMIALHFWNNFFAFVLNHMVGNGSDEEIPYSIGYKISL